MHLTLKSLLPKNSREKRINTGQKIPQCGGWWLKEVILFLLFGAQGEN